MSQRYVVLGLLVALAIITYLDRLCIAVLGPRMQADLGLSPSQWGWVLGAFTLAYAALEIPAGALGDRFGHRQVLARVVIWWSVFTALTGVVTSFWPLVMVRFLFGAGEAGAFPNITGSASRWFPGAQRARVQGIIWGASRLGAVLAPLLVLSVVAVMSWRAAFWIFGLIGIIWGIVWLAWYRDPAPAPGTVHASHAGVPWRRLLTARQLWLIMIMYAFYVWGSTFYLTWMHTYLVKGRGFSESEMGALSTLPFVLGALANPLGGVMSDELCRRLGLRTGRRLMGTTCLTLAAVLLLATALTTGKWTGIVLLSLGFGVLDLMLPSAWAVCMDVGGRHAGAVSGAMNSFGNIGGTTCSILFGYMVERYSSYNAPLMVIAGMVFVAGLVFWQIDPSRPLLAEEGQPQHATAPLTAACHATGN